MDLNLVGAVLATGGALPPIQSAYEYVLAGNGLFIRAEDSRMAALIPVAPARLPGLAPVIWYANLRTPRIPSGWLRSVLASARRHLPNERAFQFLWDDGWRCEAPFQDADPGSVTYQDCPGAVVDLHSHGALSAFFSSTDDADEQGLRYYVVIGRVDTDTPEITARVGVYGVTHRIKADAIFDGLGPFVEANNDVTE